MNVLVTGGCGFIGSNFVRLLLRERPDTEITVLDLLTYAGSLSNLCGILESRQVRVVKGDVADPAVVATLVAETDAIVHFAAESHVDRSIEDAAPFLRTNVLGTQVLLEAAREHGVERFVHVSTDEVYGALEENDPPFTEKSPFRPNSPYSASKAATEHLVRACRKTHGHPAMTVRPCNAYGPYQLPEKLIPLMTLNAAAGRPLPVYGDGLHRREWLHVEDLCDAVLAVLERGEAGAAYNVGSGEELTNLDVVRTIAQLVGASPSLIRFVEDRPGHDRRYAMRSERLRRAVGWEPERGFREGLEATVEWYLRNEAWVASVSGDEHRAFYERHYRQRLSQNGDGVPVRARGLAGAVETP